MHHLLHSWKSVFGVLNFSQLWKILDTTQQVFNHQACSLLAELSSLGNEIMIHTTLSTAISSNTSLWRTGREVEDPHLVSSSRTEPIFKSFSSTNHEQVSLLAPRCKHWLLQAVTASSEAVNSITLIILRAWPPAQPDGGLRHQDWFKISVRSKTEESHQGWCWPRGTVAAQLQVFKYTPVPRIKVPVPFQNCLMQQQLAYRRKKMWFYSVQEDWV